MDANRSKRITFVTPPLSIGGGQRVIASYAARLQQRGHHVTVVAPSHAPFTVRQIVRSIASGHGWPRHNPAHHYESGVELRILDRARPVVTADVHDSDVVVATWWETAEWVAALPPIKGVKVYFIQGYEAAPYMPMDRLDATWKLPMAKLVVAQWLADLARDRFDDPNAIVVPNAVDNKQFHAAPRGRQSHPTVGLLFAPAGFKGMDVAAAAVRAAATRLPGMRVRAFGSQRLPVGFLPENTDFRLNPPQERIRDVYAGCDVWLFSSRSEGFGLPILEAMACRTPVIATPAGAAPELLAGGGGQLVRMEDPEDMAAAIVRICTLPDKDWRAMSDAAHATARQYNWDDATDRFEAALLAAVKNGNAL